jgi:hypothetical protein
MAEERDGDTDVEYLKVLGRNVLTSSYADIYVVPSSTSSAGASGAIPQAAITSIILCETNASTATVSIQVVPKDGDYTTTPNSYEIFDTLSLTANETKIIAPGIMISTEDRIRAKAASGTVNIFIFGSEIL